MSAATLQSNPWKHSDERGMPLPAPWMLASLVLLIVGTVIQMFSYGTLQVLAPATALLLIGVVVLALTPLGGRYEFRAFVLSFAICWFWAGVAAIYANQLDDYAQTYQDAGRFFDLVTSNSVGQMSIEEISLVTTGAGAVVIWRALYELFAAIGFEKGRYIGVTANVALVAMTAVVAVQIVRTVFGEDIARLRRFTLIFALCGVFWLFAATHLRDAAGLLGVTALALFWVRYLARSTLANLLWLIAASLLAFAFFGFLRAQFLFVPLAMLASGVGAMLLSSGTRHNTRVLVVIGSVLIGLPLLAALIAVFQSDLLDFLLRGNQQYTELSQSQSDGGSLGASLISGAPLPVRVILGSPYLFVFPIPVWSGFQLETVYHLLKSLHAVYMYFVSPLFLYGAWQILRRKAWRTAPLLFLLFAAIGFTLAIAATSLETRHFGAFLVPVLVLALVPDLRREDQRTGYKSVLLLALVVMTSIHIAWAVIKLAG